MVKSEEVPSPRLEDLFAVVPTNSGLCFGPGGRAEEEASDTIAQRGYARFAESGIGFLTIPLRGEFNTRFPGRIS